MSRHAVPSGRLWGELRGTGLTSGCGLRSPRLERASESRVPAWGVGTSPLVQLWLRVTASSLFAPRRMPGGASSSSSWRGAWWDSQRGQHWEEEEQQAQDPEVKEEEAGMQEAPEVRLLSTMMGELDEETGRILALVKASENDVAFMQGATLEDEETHTHSSLTRVSDIVTQHPHDERAKVYKIMQTLIPEFNWLNAYPILSDFDLKATSMTLKATGDLEKALRREAVARVEKAVELAQVIQQIKQDIGGAREQPIELTVGGTMKEEYDTSVPRGAKTVKTPYTLALKGDLKISEARRQMGQRFPELPKDLKIQIDEQTLSGEECWTIVTAVAEVDVRSALAGGVLATQEKCVPRAWTE